MHINTTRQLVDRLGKYYDVKIKEWKQEIEEVYNYIYIYNVNIKSSMNMLNFFESTKLTTSIYGSFFQFTQNFLFLCVEAISLERHSRICSRKPPVLSIQFEFVLSRK